MPLEINTITRRPLQANPFAMENFVQPSLRGKGIRSPLLMDRFCAVLGATLREIRSQKNNRYAAHRRWAIAYVMHHSKKLDSEQIGNILHVDRTTIYHGLKQAPKLIKASPSFASMVRDLELVA